MNIINVTWIEDMASKRQKIKDEDRYSIIVPDFKHCYICGASGDIHLHEVFYGTSSRVKSIEDGCVIPLCPRCHNMSNFGVHFNKALDNRIKQQAEKIWIKTYCDSEEDGIEKFIRRYGRSYI